MQDVDRDRVLAFLGPPVTRNWQCKYSTLTCFYRYAISRVRSVLRTGVYAGKAKTVTSERQPGFVIRIRRVGPGPSDN